MIGGPDPPCQDPALEDTPRQRFNQGLGDGDVAKLLNNGWTLDLFFDMV